MEGRNGHALSLAFEAGRAGRAGRLGMVEAGFLPAALLALFLTSCTALPQKATAKGLESWVPGVEGKVHYRMR